jgi:signal transduction histidine kinase
MSGRTFIPLLLVPLASALLIGVVMFTALRTLTEGGSAEFRRNNALSWIAVLEDGPLQGSIERYRKDHPDSRMLHTHVWVVDDQGHLLEASTPNPLPESWSSLPHPVGDHELALAYRFLSLTPTATVVRLAGPAPRYAVLASPREERAHRHDVMEILLLGSALAFSALIAMLLIFVYLRIKSRQAREVLLRLERGDLKARFAIKHFDQIGNLMLDFNRMADEIERLVGRLAETEQARKTIFQELSHDLRTPLTSLRASIDTLALHWKEMPEDHRAEVLTVSQLETRYFMELMESLLFIAQMDEPRYKTTTEQVSLLDLVQEELHIRQTQETGDGSRISWELIQDSNSKASIAGDPHLLRRLVRNALENASRFAKTRVTVELKQEGAQLCLRIRDDGPGMTPDEIAMFGKARSRRVVYPGNQRHVSLGLGSVIMSKIVALHQGTLIIESAGGSGSTATGTTVEIRLPRAFGAAGA